MLVKISNLVRSAFPKRAKRYYRVGDIAPQSLLDHSDENLGAMISVDPTSNRITAIFSP